MPAPREAPVHRRQDPGPAGRPRSASGPLGGQLVRFLLVGAASALAYLLLYLVLRDPLGAQGANAVALVTTAVANTAVNRAVTFTVRGRDGALRQHLQGLVVFAAGWAITAGALGLLALAGVGSRAAEVVTLVTANAVATGVRFAMMRAWVFRRDTG